MAAAMHRLAVDLYELAHVQAPDAVTDSPELAALTPARCHCTLGEAGTSRPLRLPKNSAIRPHRRGPMRIVRLTRHHPGALREEADRARFYTHILTRQVRPWSTTREYSRQGDQR